MKLSPILLGLLAAGSMMTIGCGPGLTRQSKQPDAVFHAMDKELSHTIGTTTLTSSQLDVSQLPEDRMPVSDLVPSLDVENPYRAAGESRPKMENEDPYSHPVAVQTWSSSSASSEPVPGADPLLDTRD